MKDSKITLGSASLILAVMSACSQTVLVEKTSVDPFIEYISASTSRLETSCQFFVESLSLYQPMHLLALRGKDYFISSDYSDKFLKVLDNDGNILSETGGEGRGPGKFALINQIHKGADGIIYVLDTRLKRIHSYTLDKETGELLLRSNNTYKHNANSHISNLYVTEFGVFGVFMSLTNYETWENSYYLYKMDENFQPVMLLFELPGNDKISARDDGMGKTDDFLGSMTHWDVDGDWFYYMTTKKTDVYTFNLISGEHDSLTAITLKERENSD